MMAGDSAIRHRSPLHLAGAFRKTQVPRVAYGGPGLPGAGRMVRASDVVLLPIDDLPTRWYNVRADLPEPLPPPKDPEEGPSRVKALPDMLLGECLRQEASTERWVPIPEEILDLYAHALRPRPLVRARRLEAALKTPAKPYYQTEFLSPTGSHKVNTALAQAWHAKAAGFERLATETGAGQWGTALAYAASLVGQIGRASCRERV